MITYTGLQQAWQEVKAKSSAGGIDRISVADFEKNQQKNLMQIALQIKNKTYLPEPYLQIKIPKDRHEKRTLGLATVHDKIVQTAIKNMIEDRFEKTFYKSSYAYRPGMGPRKAINKIRHYIQAEKLSFIAKCDIDNYFDTIDHRLLFKFLKPLVNDPWLLELIKMFVKMGYIDSDEHWKDRTKGVPQGAVLSPLLANLYLTPLDQRMHDKQIHYIRYADDFIMLFHDPQKAQTELDDTINYLQNKLKLQINPGSFVREIAHGFTYLGVWITDKQITISSDKIQKLKQKISEAFRHKNFPAKYHDQVHGINNYYGSIISQHTLFPLDEHILHLWHQKLAKLPGKISKKQLKRELKNLLFVTDIYNRNIHIHKKNIIDNISVTQKSAPWQNAEQAINKRRREYRKRFMANMHLHIGGYGKFIGISKNKISVRNPDKTITKYPVKNLRYITISGRPVSISTEFINFCVNNGISVDLVKENGQPYAKIFDFHHIYVKVWTVQQQTTQTNKALHIAQNILTNKITNQIRLIKYFGKYARKKEQDIALFIPGALDQLTEIIQKIKQTQFHENYQKTLMGLEGIAAGIYWQWFRMMIDEETDFKTRITYKAIDPVNSMLNYGYAILYRHVWNSILSQGLHPEYGFLHQHQRGKAALVFDLIETFRQPVVDRAVISLINSKTPVKTEKAGKIDQHTKHKLISAIDKNLARYTTYLKKEFPVIDQIYRQTQHLRMYIMNQEKKFKPYKMIKW